LKPKSQQVIQSITRFPHGIEKVLNFKIGFQDLKTY